MNYIELRLEFNSISPFLDVLKQELADIGFDSFMDNDNGFSAFISNKLLDENLVLDLLNNYDDFIFSKKFEEHPAPLKKLIAHIIVGFILVIMARDVF